MAKNKAVEKHKSMRAAAYNWADLLDGLSAAGWEIEPDVSGIALADILIALVEAANAESGPDPMIERLAEPWAAFGLDEPATETATRYEGPARHRWGQQWAED